MYDGSLLIFLKYIYFYFEYLMEYPFHAQGGSKFSMKSFIWQIACGWKFGTKENMLRQYLSYMWASNETTEHLF